MLKILLERIRQGHRTANYPNVAPVLPERYLGRPIINASLCEAGCRKCAEACPTGAIKAIGGGPALDLGLCLFCGECANACPEGAVSFTREHRMAAAAREELMLDGSSGEYAPAAIKAEVITMFGRSLKLRQVSAGGCNACEADVNVLGTLVFDLPRFGIDFVASPRHADGLLVTGPVSKNMELALRKTYDATPSPKIVIASGACAISGGPYAGSPETLGGAGAVVPVDLYIPGCPPHPYTVLDGLLRLIGRKK